MMKKLLLFFLCLGIYSITYAQDKEITGRVVSAADNSPMPGVTIVVEGTTRGTQTDADGRFSLTASEGATLMVSFIGFTTQRIPVTGQNVYNVSIAQDSKQLQEVVVTSFGIERDKKSLGYGVSSVSSEEINKAPVTDVTNSLAGKVAGVQISGTGGGLASSNITIRGFSSITGSNQPLFVIDGVPIDNSGGSNSVNAGVANSNRASDINPNDIASISVLKGAAATVLYGSRAASGVILITTKKGEFGSKNQVNFTSNYGVGTMNRFPEFQNEYAQGSNGNYINNVPGSWGPRIAGQTVTNWFGEEEQLQAYPDNVRDILQNSKFIQNSISFSGATEKYNYRISYGNTYETGLVPNNELLRNSFSINAGTSVTDKLTINTSISYINNQSERTQAGNQGSNPLWRGIYAPRSYNLSGLPFEDELGNQLWFAGEDHPYWAIKHVKYEDETNRIYGNLHLAYDFSDWLRADFRIGGDVFTTNSKGFDEKGIRSNGNTSSAGAGGVRDREVFSRDLNSYLTVTGDKQISEDFKLTATLGNEVIANYSSNLAAVGLGIVVPGFDNLKNFLTYNPSASITQRRLMGFFGDFIVDYKDFLTLNVKGRNDFSSTLTKENRSIFYPAVAVSFVPTSAFPGLSGDVLTTAKIRANVGEVGKGAGVYNTTTYWGQADAGDGFGSTAVNFPFNGLAGFTYDNSSGNADLKPEFTREIELGTELSFFGNRLYVDASVYRRDTRNLIFAVPVPASSGFTSTITNAGKLSTKGLEVLVSGRPVVNTNFTWESTVNFTTFKTIVEELAPGVQRLTIGGFTSPNTQAVVGEQYGLIYSTDYRRDEQGRMIIGTNGLPLTAPGVSATGNPNPKFTMGFTNSFTYKAFNLSFLVDWKHKGDILSRTVGDLRIQGVSAETAEFPRFNEDGSRNKPYLFDGVLEDGRPNDIYVSSQDYWGLRGKYVAWAGYVRDASFVKLREATLSYNLPQALLAKSGFIDALQLSIYGRNLLTHAPNYPDLDPEQNLQGVSNSRGLEFGIQPIARTIGASLRATF
ncbi:SusC/RagA family TonB-linked outer membrane protein [Pontibacter akesuensis]|uniref:TonB-linked outer membrane protein, SusC/RagA family n=1 Tax=Pontibacter akesuensis TaxID=388950 RepID=A0A1I7J2N7_9BACT|nr:SusC/RagA family TonB-linked outer membrane protein [Pontibacter akesuensis]GHA72750.1 SusC/RagA family TonB-linked outer membrane protein [Pontibacter akesuensis]SFU79465.1 TonB-linked outer membrane protein, SusC/RagA family [Pontibacter akesuensis]